MTISISDNNPRIAYTATAGQTAFTVPFEFFSASDLNVYINETLKTITTHYTVSGGSGSTGAIALGTGATVNDKVVITRDVALERTTDFPSSGPFQVSSLNTELDKIIAMIADLEDLASRSITLADSDTVVSVILPNVTGRAGKVLAFNASTGAVEAGPTITATQTVAEVSADISTVAGVSANVTTVAGVASNVTTVAGIAANVTTVAGKASLITSDFVSDLNTLATSAIVEDIGILATSDIVSDLNTLATSDIVSDLNTLATSDIVSDINVLATSDVVTDLNVLATSDIVSDLNTLATSDIVSDINILATSDIVSDLNTLATSDFVSDLNTLATSANVTNISTVATNIAGVTSFAERYRVASSDPSSSLDEGDLAFNTSDNNLKFYNGSAWVSISPGISNIVEDTTPQLGGTLDANGNPINVDVIAEKTADAGVTIDGTNVKDNAIKPTDGSGTNTAGTALTVKGGAGTGTGAGGAIAFQTADGGSSGSSVNAHATRVTITDDGLVGIGTASPSNATLDVAGRGRFLQDAAATTGAIILRESSGGVGGHIQFVTNDNSGQRGFIAVDSASTMNLGGVAVTATSTPAFLARPTSTQANIANDNSVVTVAMGTEIFDQGGNFASNTFTAPITGRYQFNVIVYLTQVDSTASYYQVRLDTSNRTYFGLLDFASTDLGLGFQTIAISVLADMDANDTATVNIQQNAGSQQTDIGVESAFSGFLAC